ncbi:MAG: hormogonium polysaccharide biosynthesis protein HpsL [Leptolyngbyaceae cyanobacterium bins.59]|nr:hormogonium polysaccharide biosynthesis protein HpsL [Leptolyngbyaceae cyanobacterium bins.59]
MQKSKKKAGKGNSQKDNAKEAPVLSLKEQLAQKRQAIRERKEFIQFTTIMVFASILLGAILFAVGGVKAAGLASAIPAFGYSYKYPRKALWAFMIYMPFAGSVTYALGGNSLLQLAKDAFYVPALASLLLNWKKENKKEAFWKPKEISSTLWLLIGVCCLTLFFVNGAQQMRPEGGDKPFLLGLLGMKVFLGYIPLISATYHLIRSRKEFLFLSRLHVVLVIVCCALAFVQYMMLETGRCQGTRGLTGNQLFQASIEARCFVGGALLYTPEEGVIRLPGTFVAPWQWGWFLIANAYFSFGAAFNDPSILWRGMGLLAMVVDTVLAVISGQRIALALVPVSFAILLVLTGQLANLKRFIPIAVGLAVLLGVGYAMFPDVVQERIDSFTGRWEAAPADEFILHQLEFTWKNLKGSLIGLGIGRATNSARIFGEVTLIETWFPKVMHEIGPVGLIAFLIFVSHLTWLTFRAYRGTKDPNLRGYAASFWVFVLFISYNTYYYPLDVDPVAIYYWIFAGALLKLPVIDRQERELLEASGEAPLDGKAAKKKRLQQRTVPAS